MTLYLLSFLFQVLLFFVVGTLLLVLKGQFTKLLFGGQAFDSALILGLLGGFGYLILKAGISVYQAEEKFNTTIVLNLLLQAVKFITLLCLLAFNLLYYTSAAVAIVVTQLVFAVLVCYHIFKNHNPVAVFRSFSSCREDLKVFMSSTVWLIAYIFTLTAFQRLDIFMLSHFSSSEELAVYGVSFQYYALALMALGAIHAVMLPKFSKVEMQDHKKQKDFIVRWLKVSCWLLIPVLLVDLFGKPLFLWVNGGQYEQSFHIFVVFSIGVLLSLMFSPLINVLMARGQFGFLFFLAVIALLLNFTGNFFLIPIWGGMGAAIITIVSIGLINISSFLKCISE